MRFNAGLLAAETQILQALEKLREELATAGGQDEGEINESTVDSKALEKLREEPVTARHGVETLRVDALVNKSPVSAQRSARSPDRVRRESCDRTSPTEEALRQHERDMIHLHTSPMETCVNTSATRMLINPLTLMLVTRK